MKGTARFRYIVYFNNLWHKFEEIDSDHDRRINAEEFASGCSIIGLQLSPEEAAAEFKKCDADGGGQILFGEFCTWCAARHVAKIQIKRPPPPAPKAKAKPRTSSSAGRGFQTFGEMTADASGARNAFLEPFFYTENDHFTKAGSGQTWKS